VAALKRIVGPLVAAAKAVMSGAKVGVRWCGRPTRWVWSEAGLLKLVQWVLGFLILAAVGVAAITKRWPFDSQLDVTKYPHPTLWQLLLADRYALGLVRLAFAFLALYVIVSVPALAAASRWVKGFGKDGLTADDAVVSDSVSNLQANVKKLTEQLDTVTKEKDDAISSYEELLLEIDDG